MIAVPKHKYIRSKKLLRLVAALPCQLCGQHQFVQAAHANWGGGKGFGIKADDNLIAALCISCHYDIDQGNSLTKHERQKSWLKAHKKTIDELVVSRQWPVDIPLPTEAQYKSILLYGNELH